MFPFREIFKFMIHNNNLRFCWIILNKFPSNSAWHIWEFKIKFCELEQGTDKTGRVTGGSCRFDLSCFKFTTSDRRLNEALRWNKKVFCFRWFGVAVWLRSQVVSSLLEDHFESLSLMSPFRLSCAGGEREVNSRQVGFISVHTWSHSVMKWTKVTGNTPRLEGAPSMCPTWNEKRENSWVQNQLKQCLR